MLSLVLCFSVSPTSSDREVNGKVKLHLLPFPFDNLWGDKTVLPHTYFVRGESLKSIQSEHLKQHHSWDFIGWALIVIGKTSTLDSPSSSHLTSAYFVVIPSTLVSLSLARSKVVCFYSFRFANLFENSVFWKRLVSFTLHIPTFHSHSFLEFTFLFPRQDRELCMFQFFALRQSFWKSCLGKLLPSPTLPFFFPWHHRDLYLFLFSSFRHSFWKSRLLKIPSVLYLYFWYHCYCLHLFLAFLF